MRSLLILFLIFICNIGYSQSSYKDIIIGSWILKSSVIVHPYICGPGRDPIANTGQQYIFYKLNDFIYYPNEKHREDIIKGTWKINNENVLIINSNEDILEFKIRFYDSRLFLRNAVVELELEKK